MMDWHGAFSLVRSGNMESLENKLAGLCERLEKSLAVPGVLGSPEPGLLEGYGTLRRWVDSGKRSITIQSTDNPPSLSAHLKLATAPLRAPAMLYVLPEHDAWIVLARHAAFEIVKVLDLRSTFDYSQPTLTFMVQIPGPQRFAEGINLSLQRTPAEIFEDSSTEPVHPVRAAILKLVRGTLPYFFSHIAASTEADDPPVIPRPPAK